MQSGLVNAPPTSTEDAQIVQQLLKAQGITPQEALEKGLINDRGVYFDKTGEEIKTAIAGKIGKIRTEIDAMREKFNAGITATAESPVVPGMVADETPSPAPKFEDSWEYKYKLGIIDGLEAIARNLDPKKTFRLCGYDLEQYGL